jgi:dipeptidase
VEFRKNIPWDIGGRIWIAPRRGCVNAYMPFYYGITEIPKSLTMDSPEKAFEMHFKRTKAIYNRVDSMSWWSFVAVAEYVDSDFINRYPLRKIQKEELQRLYFKQADQFEKDFLKVFNEDQERAIKMINEFEKIILEKALSENKSFLSK